MAITVVRYRVKPKRADENAELVRAVYAELAELGPETLRYVTFRLDDGVSFVHVAVEDVGDSPLPKLGSFRRFRAQLRDRCDEGPDVRRADVVGSHGWERS